MFFFLLQVPGCPPPTALQHLQEDIFPRAFLYRLISISLAAAAAAKGASLKGSHAEGSD